MRMRAAVIERPGKTQVHEVPVQDPDAHQVRVRLEGCGLCGSDLAMWQGRPWFAYPQTAGAPGHEGWGTVEAVGSGVRTVREGDRVAGLFQNAFAEHAVTHQDRLLPIPEEAEGLPFAGEPLACAANAVERARLDAGDTVVVVGIGFIGAAITAFAKASGATVVAVSRRPYALQVARSLGADATLPLDDETATRVQERLGGLADVVFEVTGRQAPLDLAAELTRIRGRLVIAGFHQDGPRSIDMQLWNWRGLDVINAHERAPERYMEGMRKVALHVAERRLDLAPLFTHDYPLESVDEAFHAMVERPDGFLKAVIRP